MSENKFIFLWVTFSILFVLAITLIDHFLESGKDRYIFFLFLILLCIFAGYYFFGKTSSNNSDQQLISKKLYDAREEEKKKMASELHDGLQQDLHAIGFELKRLSKTTFTPKEKIESLAEKVTETIDQIRRISSELYPNQLEKLGLKKAIIGMADNLGD